MLILTKITLFVQLSDRGTINFGTCLQTTHQEDVESSFCSDCKHLPNLRITRTPRHRNIANLGTVGYSDFGDEKQVYTAILASPEISQPQIAAITKISARSVSRIISRHKDYGHLRRKGSYRKGSWECLK